MELFQELLFTVGLSLLVSFALARLLSMASADEKSVSVAKVIEESVVCKGKQSDSENNERVRSVEESINFNELENKGFRVETIGSSVNREISVCLEELKEEKVVDESSEREKFRKIEIESENLVEQSTDKVKFREIEIEFVKNEVNVAKTEEVRVFESEEEEGLFDDWEGIERTDLEKLFGSAVVFVASKSNADRISNLQSDVKMELYGLHKVAIEGPCSEPQPMALKVSARANWNAWQRLGNMSPEVAMEQYVTLLSRSIPGWKGDDTGEAEQDLSEAEAEASRNLPSKVDMQPAATNERNSEEFKPCVGEHAVIGVESPNSLTRDKQ